MLMESKIEIRHKRESSARSNSILVEKELCENFDALSPIGAVDLRNIVSIWMYAFSSLAIQIKQAVRSLSLSTLR